MKTAKILTILVLVLCVIACLAKVSEAAVMGTAFTYQGHLYDANHVANGEYDFQFKLYDANSGGSKVGGDINEPDLDVIDGYFTVELDFGGGVFDGNAVWLEIGVRGGEQNDPCTYTTLVPRQEVTPTPYALYAKATGTVPVPLNLSGPSSEPLIFANNSGGIGVRGSSNNSYGVYGTGGATAHGIRGNSDNGYGVWGISVNSYGLYGESINNYAGYFDGDTKVTGNLIVDCNVGIGTAGPGDKLDVDGHINSSESYKLDGQTVVSNAGPNNIFVGEGAGVSITSGYRNSAVGRNALRSNTGGSRNSAVGYQALYSNTYGHYNSAMGMYALFANTEGWGNSAMGYYALADNNEGVYNSAMGYAALADNNEGVYNSAMGAFALNSNTTGNRNSAMGAYALNANTTGVYNSAVGRSALRSNTTGNYNSAMGGLAGYSNETGIGNVFLGYKAGYFETGDNKLYIANSDTSTPLIYGDFATNVLRINGWAYIANRLEVESDAYFSGEVGIGTTSPTGKLQVTGDEVRIGNAGTVNYTTSDGDLYVEDRLEVDGPIWVLDAYNFFIAAGRDVQVDSTGRFGYGASSKRYKENIAPLEDDFSKILAAQPVAFVWKESKESDIGLIAEDIDELGLRNLVIYDAEGRPASVRYKFLSLYLLEVMKDLDNSIKELKETNESLTQRLDALERTAKGKEVQL